MRLWIKCLLLCLMVFGFGCSEDKLSEDLEPELTRVMEGIRFEYPQTYIPRGLNAEFKVYAIYNDLTEEELSNSDLIGNYTWSIETTDTITLSNLATTPRVVSFIGIGDVELTLDYQRNGETFSFSQTFEISTPVIASIAVEEILGSSELIDGLCCSQIADTESSMVKGCVRRFKAIATYDNGDEEDQTSDLLTWESTTNFAEPVEITNLDGYEQINSCISSISESTKGVFFAKETGYFAVSASYSGITGTSSSIEVIEPTVLSIEFDSNNPTEVIEDSKARFSVIGTLNNDTTADIDDIAWSTSNSEKGVFLSSNANGTLTSLDDDDLVDDPIIITATHFTVGSINSPVTIREKVLTFVSIEHKDEEVDLIWNEKKQFQLRAFYNNENNYLLTSGVNWTVDRPEFAEIDSEGILTAGKVTASSEWLRVTGSYQDASDDMLIKVSNSSGELINFYATPNDLKLIENYFTPVSIVGYFSNQTQQILPSDQFIMTNKSGNFDVTRDGDNFLITAHPVDTNQSVSYSAEFQLEGTSQTTQLTISDVYDVQVDSLEIIKDADLVLENTQVQLSIVPTFIGDETNSPSVNKDTVSWSCSPSCSVENGIFTAPAFDATSDATSDTFTITALVTNSDFSNQIKDISADTTIKVQKTPTVYFEKAAEITNESDITIEVTIKSSTTALKDIVVPFFIVDASSDASLTKDYRVLSNPYQVIINEGSDSAVFDIEIMDDNNVESDESIFLMIGPSVVNAAIGSQNIYELEITANDDAKVSFATGSQRKREDSGVVSIKIEQDVIHYEDVIIGYEVDDFPDCQIPNVRTAKKDYDYLTSTLTGTATIPSGSLSTTIQFHISDDSFHETDECLALRLTNVEPQRVDLGTIVSHVVTIEDDDNLVITSQHNPDNREINNTGIYTYTANITPFDGTSDNWKFNVYNEPAGSVVLTDDVNQSLSLSWETDKHDVGLLDNKIIICVSDTDTSGDYSLAPGAQTMCQPFNIEVLTCRLNGAFGDINIASDFLGLYCGGPDNHITVSNGKSLNMGVGQDFGGIVIIEPGSKFHVTDGTIDSSAGIILSGKLESTGTSLINGLLDTSGDATIGINSNGSLTYNHSSLLLDGVQLTLDLQGNGARLINENPIDLNSDNSKLLIQSSGLGNSVKHIKVTSAQGGSSEYIQVTGDVSVDALTFQADSFLKIESGGTLAITGDTDLSGDVALTVNSGGNLVFNSEFNHASNRSITIQENSTLIPRFSFTLSGDLHLYGGSKLDLSTTNFFLDHNLETSGGMLITTIDQTILNLRKPASINANQHLMLNQLLLGDHKLTLGSETSGMDVSLDVVINGSDAGIDAVNGQDLNFYGSLTLSGGSHLDSSGDGSVKVSGDLGIDNGSFITDGTADIGGMITMSEGDFSVNNGNAYLNGGNITSGNFNVSDSVVYLKNDLAINTENFIQTDLTQWYLQPESSLSLGGSSLLTFGGSLQIATGADLVINNSSNPFLTGPVTVSQGRITLSDNATFTNSITIDGSADILIPQNKELTYQHADPIIIGSENLRIYGGGVFDNSSGGAVLFGSGSGTLILGDGSSGLTELRRLDVSAIMSPPARIELKSDFFITDLETSSDIDIQTNGSDLTLKNLGIWEDLSISGFDPADFYVETINFNNKTLSFDDDVNVNSGNLFLDGAGKLTGTSLNVSANSEITSVDVTADGIDFEIDQSTLLFNGRNSFINGAFNVNNSSIHVDGDLLLTPASSSNMQAVWDISADSTLSWNGIGTMAGSIILGANSNLSLHSNRSSISAQISLNGDAGIHIGSGGLEYSGGPITLTHQLSLFGGDFDNSSDHKIIVGDNGSILLNQSSGTIDYVNLNSSKASDNHIEVNVDYEILDLSVNKDSRIFIQSGNELTISRMLTIPTNTILTVLGGGKLILNGGVNLGDGSQLKTEGSSILQIEGEIKLGTGAKIDLVEGALDLENKSIQLSSNWTIDTATLATNSWTDISTDIHELIWDAKADQVFDGTITIGNGQPGNNGKFRIIGDEADISADIYLNGGTLDIDVTTDITGQIYHIASSTIDITGDADLNYRGGVLDVGAFELTLSGDGDLFNINQLRLNDIPSSLQISSSKGSLAWLQVLSGSTSSIRVNSDSSFALSTLSIQESLTIDISSDSTFSVIEPFETPSTAQLTVMGTGKLNFPNVTFANGAAYSQQNSVITSWDGIFVRGDFNGKNSLIQLKGDVTGDGTFDVQNSHIDISSDVNLLLTGMTSLNSNINTYWDVAGGNLSWNGLGGDLNGTVDVSADQSLRLTINQAFIAADLLLQGTLALDVSADVSGDIQLGSDPKITFLENIQLNVEKPLSIPTGTNLSVAGIGKLILMDLDVSSDATLDIDETDLFLKDSPTIDGNIALNSSNLTVQDGATSFRGSGRLDIIGGDIILDQNLEIDGFDISSDGDTKWLVNNNMFLTWNSAHHLAAMQVMVGDNGGVTISKDSGDVSADFVFKNSHLEFDSTTDFKGDLLFDGTLISDATVDINVTSGNTLYYRGSEFELSGKNVVISGGGRIENKEAQTNWILLNGYGSTLSLTGENGRISNVKVDASDDKSLILTEKSYQIDRLVVESNLEIHIKENTTLTIDATLDVPSDVSVILSGKGILKLNQDLSIQGHGLIQATNGAKLDVGGDISIAENGTVDIGEGSLKLPNTGSSISGQGTLDVRNTSFVLTGDLILSSVLLTDSSTDISTDRHNLEWQPTGKDVLHGKINIDTGGFLKVTTNEADISADIYLNGGTLDIDVTTDLSGTIYHVASSAIDILSGFSLNYTGADVSVDAYVLTMKGNGIMDNVQALVLNDPLSKLQFDEKGHLKTARIENNSGIKIPSNGDYSISSLIVEQPLTVDVSQDGFLTIEESIFVPINASFHATGEGGIQVNSLVLDATFDASSFNDFRIDGDVTVNSGGKFLLSNSDVLFNNPLNTAITGEGAVDFMNSGVKLGEDLHLMLSSSSELLNDYSTRWKVNKQTLTWNGFGGVLRGVIDVSNDGGVLHLVGNHSSVEATINLEGTLKVDTTTDLKGVITLPGTNPTIETSLDALISIHEELNVPTGAILELKGNGSYDLLKSLLLEGGSTLLADNVAFTLNENPSIAGTLSLDKATLILDGSVDALNVSETLELMESQVVFKTDLTVNISDISSDSMTIWNVKESVSLNWNTTEDLKGREINLSNNSSLNLAQLGSVVSADLNINDALVQIDSTSDISGSIKLDGPAAIKVGQGKTLTYTGSEIELSDYTFQLSGQGRINNEPLHSITLDNNSVLALDGDHGRVGNVKVDSSGDNRRIEVTENFRIDSLLLEGPDTSYDIVIDFANTRELIIDSTFDVPANVTLIIQGDGTLKLNHDLVVDGEINVAGVGSVSVDGNFSIGGSGIVNIDSGSLDLQGELIIGGNLNFDGGSLSLSDSAPLTVSGGGTLDLKNVDLDLTEDLIIETDLITDQSTDVDTGHHKLQWEYDGSHPFKGTIWIDEGGMFNIVGPTEADVSADIHLNGGILKVDVTTDISGNIYHEKSSTIDVMSGVSLNYAGIDISVEACNLTMAGDGNMSNANAIVLNHNQSTLTISHDGFVHKINATSGGTGRLNIMSNPTINQLLIHNPLIVDTSPDAFLYVENDLDVYYPATFTATGEGQIQLNAIRTDSTFEVNSTEGLILFGNVDVSGDGIFDVSGIPVSLSGTSDIYFTGDGDLDFQSSPVAVNTNLNLDMSTSSDISGDTYTHWLINGRVLSWNGNGGSLRGQIDLSSDAALIIYGTPATVDATVDIYQGHIDIDTTTDINGGLVSYSSFDASMDVRSGTTLNIKNPFVINTGDFTLSGTGNLILEGLTVQGATQVNGSKMSITNDLIVNNLFGITGGSLALSGDATAINGSGTVSLSDVSVDVYSDIAIGADISSDTLTDWNLNGRVIIWNSGSDIYGSALSIGNDGYLEINSEIGIHTPLNISGAVLDMNQDTELTGNITPLAGDATIDVETGFYFDDLGNELELEDNTLILKGSGVIANTNDVVMNHGQSVLMLAGHDGMLHKAKFDKDSSPDHGIVVDDDYVIQQLTLDGAAGRVTVAPGKTLIIGDQLISQNGTNKLIKDPSNDGTIILHDIVLDGHLEIGEGFTLAPDATLYVKSSSTLTVNSDLNFNDGIIVNSGVTLTIEGGEHTVTFAGGYNLSGSGNVDVSGDVNVDIKYSHIDSTDWNNTRTNGTGTTNPSKEEALDLISFQARSGDAEITLTWEAQDATYDHVRIRRSIGGYPDSTTDGDPVCDDVTNDTFVDDNTNGVTNGVTYYYTAFAHDGSDTFAPGVHAMAAATIIPDKLVSYYMLGAEDCTNDVLLDSSGFGNHGLCQGTMNLVEDASGDSNSALEFTGSESSAEIDNPLLEVLSMDVDTTADHFTITFWIKTNQTGGDASADWFAEGNFPIIDGKIGVDQNDFGIALANNRLVFGIGFSDSTYKTYNIISKTIDTYWHHVGVTRDYDSGLMQLYLDGKLDATGDGPKPADLNSPSFLGIGRSPFGNTYFKGSLDDIRFYNRVLTESELENLYENTP